jgi:hypothetical protein
MLNSALVSVVLAFSAMIAMVECASAENAAQEAVKTSTTVAAIDERLAPLEAQHQPDSFRVSDMLLAMIAGAALVVLQLRRHQKAQSETRIINLNTLQRFNARTQRIAEAKLSQVAEPELIAHAERG